jgi:MerR family copper efflux transcriptional regulator
MSSDFGDTAMDRSIGQASTALGLSQDTMRYYEKIGLVPKAAKDRSGRRSYSDMDLTRLRFVQRAQGVGFSLDEIAQLLKLRSNPTKSSRKVRDMADQKCQAMRAQMQALQRMQDELGALLSLCDGKGEHCPILEGLDGATSKPSCC